MEEKSVELILSKLDQLANKLGVTVEQIWPWLVKQQYIDAVFSTGVFVVVSILFYRMSKFVAHHWNPESGDLYSIYREDHGATWVIGLLAVAVILICCFVDTYCNIPGILNPEYGALRDLMSMTK